MCEIIVVICPTTQAFVAATKKPDGQFAHDGYALGRSFDAVMSRRIVLRNLTAMSSWRETASTQCGRVVAAVIKHHAFPEMVMEPHRRMTFVPSLNVPNQVRTSGFELADSAAHMLA